MAAAGFGTDGAVNAPPLTPRPGFPYVRGPWLRLIDGAIPELAARPSSEGRHRIRFAAAPARGGPLKLTVRA